MADSDVSNDINKPLESTSYTHDVIGAGGEAAESLRSSSAAEPDEANAADDTTSEPTGTNGYLADARIQDEIETRPVSDSVQPEMYSSVLGADAAELSVDNGDNMENTERVIHSADESISEVEPIRQLDEAVGASYDDIPEPPVYYESDTERAHDPSTMDNAQPLEPEIHTNGRTVRELQRHDDINDNNVLQSTSYLDSQDHMNGQIGNGLDEAETSLSGDYTATTNYVSQPNVYEQRMSTSHHVTAEPFPMSHVPDGSHSMMIMQSYADQSKPGTFKPLAHWVAVGISIFGMLAIIAISIYFGLYN